jgi:hypothetical protein
MGRIWVHGEREQLRTEVHRAEESLARSAKRIRRHLRDLDALPTLGSGLAQIGL